MEFRSLLAGYRRLCDEYVFGERGEVVQKGEGPRRAYLLPGRPAAGAIS